METWVLIIYIYVIQLRQSSSGSMTSVPGFVSVTECYKAGELAKQDLAKEEDARVYFVCIPQNKKK